MRESDELAVLRAELRAQLARVERAQAALHDELHRHAGLLSRAALEKDLRAERQAERNAARAELRRGRTQARSQRRG